MLNIRPTIDVPLRVDESGAVRVGNTRVTLHTVISAFKHGETPEAIVQSFDVLKLKDVYAVLAYYLLYPDEVETYIHDYEVESERFRAEHPEVFVNFTQSGLRERLLARVEQNRVDQNADESK